MTFFSRSAIFFINAIRSTIFYVSLRNVYQISITPIALSNTKMGTHAAKTRPLLTLIYRDMLKTVEISGKLPDN